MAYVTCDDLNFVVPAEPVSLGSTAYLEVRGLDGREALVGQASDLDAPSWSRDGEWLAFSYGGQLRLWNARTGKVSAPSAQGPGGPAGFISVKGWTWTESGVLRWLGRSNHVWQFDPATGKGVRLSGYGTGWSGQSAARLSLSPTGRLCAKQERGGTELVEVNTGEVVSPELPGFVRWSPVDRVCLLKDIRLDDPSRNDGLYVYATESRALKEVTDLLPLPDAPKTYRMFSETGWSADGSRFICRLQWATDSRIQGHLLCQVEPWSALNLERELAAEIQNVRLAPSGQFLAFERKGRERGIHVAEILATAEGGLALGKSARVWPSLWFHDWFWSPVAPEIVVAKGNQFHRVGVVEALRQPVSTGK